MLNVQLLKVVPANKPEFPASTELLLLFRVSFVNCAMLGKKSKCRVKKGKQGAEGVESS